MNSCYTLLLLHQLRIWTLDWTLHRSKCAGYHYVVMWSCSICITTHITHSKPAVPILCLRAYIIFSCQITQSHFGLHYLLLCDAAVAVVQSEGLFHWKVFSVFFVILVATAFALSTWLGTKVLLAYIVVVPTGVKMLINFSTCFIDKAARCLYCRGQQYQVSL